METRIKGFNRHVGVLEKILGFKGFHLFVLLNLISNESRTQANRLSSATKISQNSEPEVYLRVSTILLEPYLMSRWDLEGASVTHAYEGYIVDLMDEISRVLGIRYKLLPVADGQFGYRKSDQTWNGMIGELMNKKADLAAAPLYITKQRREVVDFSVPFLTNQATILLKRPPTGHELPVGSVEDLISQWDLDYGTLNTGMIVKAFRASNDTLTRTLWKNMRSFRPSTFTDSNEEGIARVREGSYAFILPSTIGDYVTRRQPCDLVMVDRFLMNGAFGLAAQKGSTLTAQIDRALLLLDREGYLAELYNKWWVKRSDCNGIQSSKIYSLGASGAPALTLSLWCLYITIFSGLAAGKLKTYFSLDHIELPQNNELSAHI